MRNLIATCQLVILTVIAVSIVHEFRNSEVNRQARLKLLQSLSAVESSQCEQAPQMLPQSMADVAFTSGVTITTSEWLPIQRAFDPCHGAGGCIVTLPPR